MGRIYSVIKRKDARHAMAAVHQKDDDAFVTIGEIPAIRYGWLFPKRRK